MLNLNSTTPAAEVAMDTLVVLLLKVLLLLISLTIYQNHSRNPFENEVLVNEAIANASSVYITNRYFQQVISIGDGIKLREKIGRRLENIEYV